MVVTMMGSLPRNMRESGRGWVGGDRWARLIVAGLILVSGVFILFHEEQFRVLEVRLFAQMFDQLIPGGVMVWRDYIVFAVSDAGTKVALHLTPECATYVLLLPFLLFVAVVLTVTRMRWLWWMIATALCGTGIVMVNLTRIWMIVFATNRWGIHPGYDLSHGLLGSAFAILGTALLLLVALVLMTRGPWRSRRRGRRAANNTGNARR